MRAVTLRDLRKTYFLEHSCDARVFDDLLASLGQVVQGRQSVRLPTAELCDQGENRRRPLRESGQSPQDQIGRASCRERV